MERRIGIYEKEKRYKKKPRDSARLKYVYILNQSNLIRDAALRVQIAISGGGDAASPKSIKLIFNYT